MFAVPFALIVVGYWVMWAGVKQTSLLDAWNCVANPKQTPVSEPSPAPPGTPTPQPAPSPKPSPQPSCQSQPGDTKVPLPGGHYIIIRPAATGLLGIAAAQVITC